MLDMSEAEFSDTIRSLAWKGLVEIERDVDTDELRVSLTDAGYTALALDAAAGKEAQR